MAKFTNKRGWYLLNKAGFYILALILFSITTFLLNRWVSPYFPEHGILEILLQIFIVVLFIAAMIEANRWCKKTNNYLTGDDGEVIIEDILKKLPDEFIVIPDLKLPKQGNIDFVVVGPTGIFALEVKNFRQLYNFNLAKNYRKSSVYQTNRNAITLGTYLRTTLNDPYVIAVPVLVFAKEQNLPTTPKAENSNLKTVCSKHLIELLTKKGRVSISNSEVTKIAKTIKNTCSRD